MSNGNEPGNYSSDEGSELVSILMPGRDVAEFIASMLGQRRTLSKTFPNFFRISHDWLVGFVELTHQRIIAQNDGKIISFKFELSYIGGRKLEIFDKRDFSTFNDVSRDISSNVKIVMTYFIKFPNRKNFERQDITLSASADIDFKEYGTDGARRVRSVLIPLSDDLGTINIEIQHTDITWGEDLMGVMSNHIETNFPRRNRWLDSIRVYSIAFMPIVFMFLIGTFGLIGDYTGSKKAIEFIRSLGEHFNTITGNVRDLEEKINSIAHYNMAIEEKKGFSNLLFDFLYTSVVLGSFYSLTFLRNPSYVIMNKATQIFVDNRDVTFSRFKSIAIVTLLLGAISGVFGNIIFAKLQNLW